MIIKKILITAIVALATLSVLIPEIVDTRALAVDAVTRQCVLDVDNRYTYVGLGYPGSIGGELCDTNCSWGNYGWTIACFRLMRCNCGTAAIPCWRGSVYYASCTTLCAALAPECAAPPSCTPACGTCTAGTYPDPNPGNSYISGTCTYTKSDCGTETRSCYTTCPSASCSTLPALPDGRVWQDNIPAVPYSSVTRTIPISSPPPGCPSSGVKTCYIVNVQPQLKDLEIQPGLFAASSLNYLMAKTKSPIFEYLVKDVKAQGIDSVLGFTSNTHTGTELNNPVKLNATFSDLDGNDDISALYIWWSKDSETKDFITPNILGTSSAQTLNDSSFGFMVKRIGANWGIVYVPSFADLLTPKWVVPTPLEKIFGPDQKNAVNLYNVFLTDSLDRPNEVDLSVLLDIPDEGDIDKILNGTYHVWALVNDVVGFLPFGDDKEIEDDSWGDSGEEWTVDLVNPAIENVEIVTGADDKVIIDFDSTDDLELSYVRVDACRSGGITPIPTISSESPYNTDPYTMSDCGSFSVADITANTDLLGTEGEILGALSYSPSNLVIDLNGNTGGSITFRITAMDNAGNFIFRDVTYALGEWAITKDGLVYGANGVSSTTRKLEDGGVWSGSKLLTPPFSFLPLEADLTDQVLLKGSANAASFLGTLERYTDNQSFKAANFPGVYINSPYQELLMAYNVKKENLINQGLLEEKALDSVAMGRQWRMSTICSPLNFDYCVATTGSTTIPKNSLCDQKGLIIVDGDLTIRPNMTNSDPSNACIILVSGNIVIEEGDPRDDSGDFGYDNINAFLIAGGEIIINEDTNNDGLIIEGGLAAFSPTSSRAIVNSRQMEAASRNTYPVLAVNNNAKYGLLSKTLFGSQIDIFKVEVGFKPY